MLPVCVIVVCMLRHMHFLRALRKKELRCVKLWQIKTCVHNLMTVLVSNSTHNLNNCKCIMLDNGIVTLAYGHYSLRRAE